MNDRLIKSSPLERELYEVRQELVVYKWVSLVLFGAVLYFYYYYIKGGC